MWVPALPWEFAPQRQIHVLLVHMCVLSVLPHEHAKQSASLSACVSYPSGSEDHSKFRGVGVCVVKVLAIWL